MKLTWLGHACFLLESSDGSVLFDPYAPGYVPGLALPALEADLCLCSHGHGDHNCSQAVRLSGKTCRMKIRRIPSFHDEEGGALRGENILTLVETEGLRLLHAGDLGHALTSGQKEALGRVDVLLLPVGGTYTLDSAGAAALVKELQPGITIPMHYRGEGFGFDVLEPVEHFLRHFEEVCRLDSNQLTLPCDSAAITVLRCPVS